MDKYRVESPSPKLPMGDRISPILRTLILVLPLLSVPTPSFAIFGDSEESFGLDGSLRSNLFFLHQPDLSFTPADDEDRADGLANLLFRLTAAGRPAENVKYEFHVVSSTILNATEKTGGAGPSLFGAQGSDSLRLRYRMVDDAYEMRDEPDVNSQVGVDRLNVSIYLPFADVTVGRQAISFGKAYLWNPLDVFRPFDPTSFDRDYKIGVDALRVDMPFGETGTVTMVGALSLGDGNEDHGVWFGSAALARVGWMAATWDWVVQGGKVYGGFQVGGAASGDIKNLSVRLEGMHFEPLADDEFDRHQSLVLGVGRAFQNTLNIQLEYFYNGGAGALRDSAVDAVVPPGAPVDALSSEHLNRIVALVRGVLNGRLYHTSEHLAGLVVTYEILPILKANLATIVSVSEPSALIQPGLTYSAADEVDVVIGAMFSAGARRSGEEPVCQALGGCLESEFGTYPHVFYLQSKIYF